MNSKDIARLAECMLSRTNYLFLGVYARDQLPMINEIDRFPACLISNTDTSDGPGIHWIAITYVSRANLEFFDSYALQPSDYLFDSLTNQPINLSLFQIQHDDSDRCGHHCLYYLFKRSHNFSLSRIFTLFSPSALHQNDMLVGHFVKHLRKLCTAHSLSNKAFCNHACICKCKTCYCRKIS